MRKSDRISAIFKVINNHRLMIITEKECKIELRKLGARQAINLTSYNEVSDFVNSEKTDYSGYDGVKPRKDNWWY